MIHWFLAACLLLTLGCTASGDRQGGGDLLAVGERAPDFTATAAGGDFRLSAFQREHPDAPLVIAFSRAKW